MFSQRLKELRESKGLLQENLADILEIPRSSIGQYESGESDRIPRKDRLEKIADYFNVSVDYLLGRTNEKSNAKLQLKRNMLEKSNNKLNGIIAKHKTRSHDTGIRVLPIYGSVKAGYGSFGEQNIEGYEMVSSESVSDGGEYFFLTVHGDSMIEEGIFEGCKVLVRKQGHVEDGKIGVVLVNGEEATLKRVYYDNDKVILRASNKNMAPKPYNLSEIVIQGQVKSVVFDV